MERRTSLAASLVARHPVAADWLLTGVVTVAALTQASAHPQRGVTPVRLTVLGAVLAVAGSVPVAWRRRSPLGVLVLTELAVLLQLLLESDNVREGAGAGGSPGPDRRVVHGGDLLRTEGLGPGHGHGDARQCRGAAGPSALH